MNNNTPLFDIGANKRQPFTDEEKRRIERYDLEHYYKLARGSILFFRGKSCGQADALKLCENEDAVAYVAHHIMVGMGRWNPDKGMKLKSYLYQCAHWAIKRLITSIYIKTDGCFISLSYFDTIEDEDSRIDVPFYDGSIDRMIDQEYLFSILDEVELTDSQRSYINLALQGNSDVEIGTALSISRQAVHIRKQEAFRKIRAHVGDIG